MILVSSSQAVTGSLLNSSYYAETHGHLIATEVKALFAAGMPAVWDADVAFLFTNAQPQRGRYEK
jgi:hypothetical protein